ncbi:hypothetical protein ACDY97_26955 [Rhizobium mongolense]|uniref:hypothetical protein n=1 Tax=Rhizobium mongolense TaxID=57676 RepID=UPI0035575C07
MTPEKALAIRVRRVLSKKIASRKVPDRLVPSPDVTKQILVFKQGEFHHLIHSFVVYGMPGNEVGVSIRKAVYPIRYSGEYLYIDISTGRTPKKTCSIVTRAAIAPERIIVTPSPPIQSLAQEFLEHAHGSTLRKLASEIRTHPTIMGTTNAPARTHALTYTERWIRQLNLAFNQAATEQVRKKALMQLAKIEEELLSLNEEYFKWPSTEALNGSGSLTSFDAPKDGVLSFFGYHVGKGSILTSRMRCAILDRVFRIVLPPILPSWHMESWGTPESSRRLRKMAETIAALARNAKHRRSPSYDQAVGDWEHDLQRLHDTHYVGRFDFGWPVTHTV